MGLGTGRAWFLFLVILIYCVTGTVPFSEPGVGVCVHGCVRACVRVCPCVCAALDAQSGTSCETIHSPDPSSAEGTWKLVDGEVQPEVTQKGQCPCFLWSTSLGAELPVCLWCRLCYTNCQEQVCPCLCLLWNELTLVFPFACCKRWFPASLDFPIWDGVVR